MIREGRSEEAESIPRAAIEDAIIAHPDKLGFPEALAVRNFRLADTSGAVDVVLLPP
jgi:hypothetical protein